MKPKYLSLSLAILNTVMQCYPSPTCFWSKNSQLAEYNLLLHCTLLQFQQSTKKQPGAAQQEWRWRNSGLKVQGQVEPFWLFKSPIFSPLCVSATWKTCFLSCFNRSDQDMRKPMNLSSYQKIVFWTQSKRGTQVSKGLPVFKFSVSKEIEPIKHADCRDFW